MLIKLILFTTLLFPNQDFLKNLKQDKGSFEDNQVRALKTELLVEASEKKALVQIKKLISMYKGSPMEAGLRLRMAELYMRMSKTERFFEINRDSKTIVKLVPQRAKKASEKNYILRAVKTYDSIERRFPNFRDMDLVLFNSGFARQQIGKDNQAKTKYSKLIQKYTTSPLIPEAYLALGEMEFEEHKFKTATNYFEKIKEYPNSKIYPYGRYKLAWSYFNLTRNEEALAELEAVVDYGKENKYARSNKRLDLKKEALADMVLFYSEFKPAKEALSYFTKYAGKEEAPHYLLKLAKLYQRHGKKRAQIVILQDVIDKLSKSYFVARAYKDLAEVFESERNHTRVVNILEDFKKICKKDSSWQKRFDTIDFSKTDYQKKNLACEANYDGFLVPLVQNWDKKVRKDAANKSLYNNTVRAYEIYLEDSEGKKNDVNMHFALAELLFNKKDYRRASKEYYLTAQKAQDKEKIHDASYSSIVSLEKSVKDKWSREDENHYIKLATFYISKNPKGQYIEQVEFKRAFIVYDSGRYQEAAPMLKELGEKYAYKEQGKKAQDLYLDILNQNKDYLKIKEYTNFLLSKNYKKKRKDKIKNLYQESYFLSIQVTEKNAPVKSYKEYQDFAKSNMDSPLAEKAWWNSLSLLQKIDNKKALASSAYEYVKLFPKAEHITESLILSVQSYEAIANFEGAIKVLTRLIEIDKNKKDKWLELKADYLYLTGDYNKAKVTYKKLAKSTNVKQRVQIYEKLAEMEKEKGNNKEYERLLDVISRTGVQPQASRAHVYFVYEWYKKGLYPQAFKSASDVLTMPKSASNKARAKARWIQSMILADEFYRQSVKSTQPERIPLVLAIKTEKLDKAQRAFEATIRYNDPKLSAKSLVEMAKLYREYAKAVKKIRLPAGIPEGDAESFYVEMQNLAIPMEEREVETLFQAAEVIAELGIYDGSYAKVKERLEILNSKPQIDYAPEIEKPVVLVPDVSGV